MSSFTTNGRHALNSNVTVDGCLNGQNGVTFDHSLALNKNALIIADPTDNVIIRCINFRGTGFAYVAVGSTTTQVRSGGETTLLDILPMSVGYGAAGLRFMGVLDAEHNYRPKIF